MHLLSAINSLNCDGVQEVDYQDFTLELCCKVHPLRNMLPESKCILPAIVVSKKSHQEENQQTPKAERPDRDASNVSYEGSPLKLQVFATDNTMTTTASGKLIKALNAKEARVFLSTYITCAERLEQRLPVWLLCNTEDPKKVACMGHHLTPAAEGPGTNLLHTLVTVTGPLNKRNLPKASSIKSDHCWPTGKQTFECDCSAEYNILDATALGVTTDSIQGSLKINVMWKDVTELLSHPPPDARATVSVCLVAGSPSSHAYSFFEELLVLKGIANGLRSNVVEWSGTGATVPVMDRVRNFVNDIKKWDGERSVNVKQESDEDNREDRSFNSMKERNDLDFTEKLWNIVKDCSCMGELVEALSFVLASLHKGEIQPMVNKSNESHLAEIARKSFFQKIVVPQLQDTEALEMLVDIGLEKLMRDYVYTLTGKNLVTVAHHLSSYIQRDGGLLDRLDRLERLHYVLELVIALEQYALLPTSVLSYAARHALKYYENNAAVDWHTFTIPMPSNNIADITDQWPAKEWKVEFTTKLNQTSLSSIHLLSSDSLMDHLPWPSTTTALDNLDSSASSKGKVDWQYYYTCVTESITQLS